MKIRKLCNYFRTSWSQSAGWSVCEWQTFTRLCPKTYRRISSDGSATLWYFSSTSCLTWVCVKNTDKVLRNRLHKARINRWKQNQSNYYYYSAITNIGSRFKWYHSKPFKCQCRKLFYNQRTISIQVRHSQ